MLSLCTMTFNALCAADSVIITTQPKFLSVNGLEQLLSTINHVRKQINPNLKVDGILINMVYVRTRLGREPINVFRRVYSKFSGVFNTAIPMPVKAKEAIEAIMSEEKLNQREKSLFRDSRISNAIPNTIPKEQQCEFVIKAI